MIEKPKIVTTYMTNPFEPGQGGGVRYVRNLLVECRDHCDEILFLGTAPRDRTEGNVRLISITSKKQCGYLRFLILLILRLPFIDMSSYDVVHVHRSYFAIPFLIKVLITASVGLHFTA